MKYGYACINTDLEKVGITTNRTLRRKTLAEKGLKYYESLIIQNIKDLKKILEWNESFGIKFFRISADLFTHRDQIKIYELPSYKIIKNLLKDVGDYIQEKNHRVSFHADHYTILASQRNEVVEKAIIDLNFLGEIFDLMGLPQTCEYKINVHVGTFKPSKKEAALRFVENVQKLSLSARRRLTVENDDSSNGFSTKDLYEYIYEPYIPIPIVFDYHHHSLNSGGIEEQAALQIAISTWPVQIPAVTHYSSSRKIYEDLNARNIAHADFIHEKIQTYGLDFDIMFEAKAKEKAVLKYLLND